MKTNFAKTVLWMVVVLAAAEVTNASPVGTAFTDQGQLKQDGGAPANDGAAALSAEKDARMARLTERPEHVETLLPGMVQERKGSK